ncbi:MAG: energy transducer TonB [Methylotenera sp.]
MKAYISITFLTIFSLIGCAGPTETQGPAHYKVSTSNTEIAFAKLKEYISKYARPANNLHIDNPLSLINGELPDYPPEARKHGIEGLVTIAFSVNEQGFVESTEVLQSPHQILTEECIKVVKAWYFKPVTINNEPVKFKAAIPLEFKLEYNNLTPLSFKRDGRLAASLVKRYAP